MSGDALTARFLTSPDVIRDGTLVVVVAWMLDGVVAGSPTLHRIYVDDAKRLATVRDTAWEGIDPPDSHRVLQPDNAPGTTRNQLQTQVRGQQRNQAGEWVAESQNFGKLWRFYDPDVTAFHDEVLAHRVAAKPLKAWRNFVTG